jgi:helicase
VIRDYRRFEEGAGNRPIPVLEYKQMAGRAGRPSYDSYGEAVLIARTPDELDSLMEHYTSSNSESIVSKLSSPDALRFHLLAAIATETVGSREDIDSLLKGTFYSVQFARNRIGKRISTAIRFLERNKLIETDATGRFHATVLGQRVSRLYIDPRTAIVFQKKLPDEESVSVLGILHLICHTPDQPCSYVNQAEFEEYSYFVEAHKDDLLVAPPEDEGSRKYHRFLAEIKTASMLNDWISEISEHDLTENYTVGMGDVHRYVESAEWLVLSASEIARAMGMFKPLRVLQEIRTRLKYGVRPDILELVALKGIGRIRGRMLHGHGYTTLAALYSSPVESIARVPSIGTSVAESIKKQLGFEIDSRYSSESLEESQLDANRGQQTLLDDFSEY